MEIAVKIESFHHPATTPPGTLEFQLSWVKLDGAGGGKLVTSVIASRDLADDLRQAVAQRLSVHPPPGVGDRRLNG